MAIKTRSRSLAPLFTALLLSPAAAWGQIQVVDMIPAAMSGETRNNAEPYIAVNPANNDLIAATAFMATPAASPNGPMFVSTDGGNTWVARNIIPSSPGAFFNTGDITIRFNSEGTALYGAILRVGAPGGLQVIRTTDMTLTTPMTAVYSPGATDQPYIYARTVTGWFDPGKDRVWVGNNENAAAPASATLDQSLDSGAMAPSFTEHRIDGGAVVDRNNYQVRTVAHPDGHVYTAFYRRKGAIVGGYNADIVVVRDDNWGIGGSPHEVLVDTVTMISGQNVVTSTPVSDTFGDSQALGKDWWGGDLYLTVDPNRSGHVYISYSDSQAGSPRTIHLRRSTDFGQTWGADLLTVQSAKNAAIAINSQGRIGYLYQELSGTSPNLRWWTRLRRSDDGASWSNVLLADFPAEGPNSPTGSRVLGDYLNLVAVGKNFYGVFSSYNDLVNASFPQGVTWLRNRTAPADPMPRFLGVDGLTTVAPSVDPFFFRTVEADPVEDLYVRDWTDSGTVHDQGQEPSIRNNFYSTSDVWNRRNNNPQPFDANDRPQSQDPRPASMGPNWAFARVSREAAGTPLDVTVRFLFSDGGVGVPYVSAGPPIMLHLDAADLEKAMAPGGGYQWNLPSGASNHVCLAVEISTADDPTIPPGLLGNAPGWPTTDLLVVADNNKAQRNLNVFGFGGMGAGAQAGSAYAIVGNASDRLRDVAIGLDVDSRRLQELRSATVGVRGGAGPEIQRVEPQGIVVLPAMEPGETRWLEFRFIPSEQVGEPLELTINELVAGQPVNGYSFVVAPRPLAGAIEDTLFQHTAVFVRLDEAFGVPGAAKLADEARELLDQGPVDASRYLRFLNGAQGKIQEAAEWLTGASRDAGDPFGVVEAVAGLTDGGDAAVTQVRHLSLLNKLDALATYYQRSEAKIREPGLARRRLLFGLNVGSAHPLDDLDRVADANVYLSGDVAFRLTDRVDIQGILGLAQFTSETAAAIEHPRWLHLSANARFLFPTPTGLAPYLRAGPGLYDPKSGSSEAGFNLGVGGQLPIPSSSGLRFGADYHWIDDEASTRFVTVHLGLSFW